jgi:hypothetical protein
MQKLSFALGILILPSAFHSVQAQTADTRIKTATISGRVTVKGDPAQGVLVYLHPDSSPAPSNPDAYLRASTERRLVRLPSRDSTPWARRGAKQFHDQRR